METGVTGFSTRSRKAHSARACGVAVCVPAIVLLRPAAAGRRLRVRD